MKIVEHNHQYLEITDQNCQGLWGLLFSMPFLLVGLGVIAGTAKVITLECQRTTTTPSIVCQRTVAGILGTEKDQIPGQLQKATVLKASGTGVVLGTTTNTLQLAPYHVFVNNQHFETADRINAFLQNPQQTTLRVEQDDRLANTEFSWGFLFGGIFVAISFLYVPKKVGCKFDKISGQVILNQHYWLLGNRQTSLPWSEIQQLRIKSFHAQGGDVYQLQLVKSSGQKVSLSILSRDVSEYQAIADRANQFLHQA